MNEVTAAYQDCHIHVVLGQSVHPQAQARLARHKNVTFHYTQTHTSWLNQIEIWFSILTGKSLKGASFNAVEDLKTHIDVFMRDYNETASEVYQKRLKPCFANQ